MKRFFCLVACLLVGAATNCWAQIPDVEGSSDHSEFGRYPGAFIVGYSQEEFGHHQFLTGPLRGRNLEKVLDADGKFTRILYAAPAERSPYEVFLNYKQALSNDGFEILYSFGESGRSQRGRILASVLLPPEKRLRNHLWARRAFTPASDVYYLSARSRNGNTVALMVGRCTYKNIPISDRPVALLEVVEGTPLDQGLEVATAEKLYKTMEQDGSVNIDSSVLFDFDRAELKPEAASVLEEVSQVFRAHRDVKMIIIGHTDAKGKPQYNHRLSVRRAQAVKDSLVNDFGVSATRLDTQGLGPDRPVANNETESGRALNRRVEFSLDR
jgi:OOP family OmpA-OmpF porin